MWSANIPLKLAIIMAIAGLGVFLFAIRLMSGALKTITSGYTVKILNKFSSSPWLGMLFGFIFTSIIQSSDGAVALSIGLVGAGMMSMKGAIAFILGANIGTSTTSLIVWVSKVASFTQYFMIAVFIGIMMLMLFKEERKMNIGMLLASFGLIFVGLKMLGWGMSSVGQTPGFQSMFAAVSINPWAGLFSSIGLTGLMQSSSVSITIVQHMYGAMPTEVFLPSSIAMILGANIGTTFTAFLISVGGNKDARRIAVIWLFINFIFSLIFMFLIYPWNGYGWLVSNITSEHEGQLSMAHLLFNVSLSFTFIFFVNQLTWFVYKIVPKEKTILPYKTSIPLSLISESPQIAFQAARNVTKELAIMTRDSMELLYKYYQEKDLNSYKKYKELMWLIDITRKNLYAFLIELGSTDISKNIANRHMSLVLASRSLERIPILGKQVADEIRLTYNSKINQFDIPKEDYLEVKNIIKMILLITKRIPNQIIRYSSVRAKDIVDLSENIDSYVETYVANFIGRKRKTKFDFIQTLKTLERMSHHAVRVNKYISRGRKKTQIKDLPINLKKEILKNF